MFDLKKELRIYTYAPHAEWQTALAGLAMEGDSYVVPYKMCLQDKPANSNGTQRLFKVLVTVDLPLSVEARELAVLPSNQELYYASELLRLMQEHPEITIHTLNKGMKIIRRLSKKDASEQIARLSPERMMQTILHEIRAHVQPRRRDVKTGKLRRSVLLHALYGINITQQTTKKTVSEAASNVQTVDFGFRDVAHARSLLALIADPKTRVAVTPMEFAERINEMDELLAKFGRPVVRSVPASVWLRKVCRHVKTSPLYEAPDNTAQPTNIMAV